MIDLFAGAGGLSVGARKAGAEVAVAVELDAAACETLRLNHRYHGGRVLREDVSEVDGRELRDAAALRRGDALLVIGGPPCQPFSKAAYWAESGEEARYRKARARGEHAVRPTAPRTAKPDNRRSLVSHFWRLVLECDADGFLFENVPSALHPRHRETIDRLLLSAQRKGFETTIIRANAANFGVPQRRERIFILGARGARPASPVPTHGSVGSFAGRIRPVVTAGKALAGFDSMRYFEPEEVIVGRWAKHLEEVPPGWNYKAHTAWGGHPNPTFEAERRFWNFLLKLSPDLPSWTIAANPGPWTGPFHWSTRRLRTPELAALQTFPRGYKFSGNRRERVRQIGNAVPCRLAHKMMGALISAINGEVEARTVA